MSESRQIATMRAMAWERAKGELLSYLHTFWPEYYLDGKEIDNRYELAATTINKFIKDFEYNCR